MNAVSENLQSAENGKALVLGMGATGISIASWLAANGRSGIFADSRRQPPGCAAIQDLLPDAQLQCGDLPGSVPQDVSEILISPGLELDLPLLKDAEARNIPVRSDIDLFMGVCEGRVLGITGSNGKSTVTKLVEGMLNAAGVTVAAGANLGTPALDLLASSAEVFVLELSSFQLERSDYLQLHAAVLLNVSPDHLDHHASIEDYAAAKARIYKCCGTAVVNRDEPDMFQQTETSEQISFGLGLPAPTDWGIVECDDGQWIARGNFLVMPVAELQLVGQHNLLNVLAAFAIASTLDVPVDGLVTAARLFTGLPHRMQRVPTRDGIVWINDSKATNEAAALASINSVDGRLILIAGGDAKGGDLELLRTTLEHRDVSVIVLGKDRDLFHAQLSDVCEVRSAESLEKAVAMAAVTASSSDTVLLAPACSSLDMFSGYGERGERFCQAVQSLSMSMEDHS
jgi:UDP-N-acetylmuramoylalanine--D-glutamate ligase